MTKHEAHALLDCARNGANVSIGDITEALRATGDLSRRIAEPQHRVASRQWPFYATESGRQLEEVAR